MIKTSLNLPKYRLHIQLVKRRGPLFEEPLLPDIQTIKKTKSGNKGSRFFRHIFEHKKINKILGTNLFAMMLFASFVPVHAVSTNTKDASNQTIVQSEAIKLVTEKGTQYPINTIKINQGYRFYHPGIDLDGEKGDVVKPIMAGKIESVEYSKFAYGVNIIVNHGNNLTSLYAHLSKIDVNVGQEVDKNTKIGEVGSTGWSTGTHLHLEIRDKGIAINPSTVLPR